MYLLLFMLFQRSFATDDIFSEFLSYGSRHDAMPLIHRSIYFMTCLLFTVFLIFMSYSYKKTSVSILFIFYLIQVLTQALDLFINTRMHLFSIPKHISLFVVRRPSWFLGLYICVSILSVFMIWYNKFTSNIPLSLLLYHSFLSYYITKKFYFNLLTYLIVSILVFLFSRASFNLILVFYGAFFFLVLVKLLILDNLRIRNKLRTESRFNFRKDFKLVVIFTILFILNGVYQIYRNGWYEFIYIVKIFNLK
ncbi:hypothetical protein P3W45_001351 [Vairimorpha bombi]